MLTISWKKGWILLCSTSRPPRDGLLGFLSSGFLRLLGRFRRDDLHLLSLGPHQLDHQWPDREPRDVGKHDLQVGEHGSAPDSELVEVAPRHLGVGSHPVVVRQDDHVVVVVAFVATVASGVVRQVKVEVFTAGLAAK